MRKIDKFVQVTAGCVLIAVIAVCSVKTVATLTTRAIADSTRTAEIVPQSEETTTIEELNDYDDFVNEIKELNPCKEYDVPLDADTKKYIETMCRCYRIDPAIIYGIIKTESNFDASIIGDNGNSYGLMQIQPRWNKSRMKELNITNLLDAKQNVFCGIDILAELMEKYDSVEMALTCYNYGENGAQKYVFSKGVYSSAYSDKVLEYAYQLTK